MRMENTPKIVIAAINGHAVGGGLEIAMACDIRIAKKEGGRVGFAEINLGVMPGMGGTQRLPRLVGKARALELCATGKTIAFEEALEMGLVHYIYEKDNFMEQVMDYARQFIVPNKSSLAVGKVKRAIKPDSSCPCPMVWHSSVSCWRRPSAAKTARKASKPISKNAPHNSKESKHCPFSV